ncbi:MAG: nickel pincer cofactor biosynthesis protein LarC [Chitinivibrionia bacterium]|nr:nickel pincer cofactor biosynthesis protein LarC [Chitinivibrionia bacterium]
MKNLYIECDMGAAGDMLMAALMELCPDPKKFIEKMNAIGLENTVVKAVKREKCGIVGSGIDVIVNGIIEGDAVGATASGRPHNANNRYHDHDHKHHNHHEEHHHHNEHNHSSLECIKSLIYSLDIPENVKEKATEVYSALAEAEAFVHGREVSHVHFHEVGTLDAVCDIVGCCLALDTIKPDKITVSPVHVGFGSVKCQHGVLPVPAPATAYLLKGIPAYGGEIKGELCTPTGAALLKTFAHSFGNMSVMTVEKIGYGMGKRSFERLNCVRAFLGETEQNSDDVYEISCNLDDITAEELAFSYDLIFEAGALDVFATPTVMKKGRPGHILTALAKADKKDVVAKAILTHTTTRGVRISQKNRLTLSSKTETVETKYGNIVIKVSSGYGISKTKPEYESVATAAKKHCVSFAEVKKCAVLEFAITETDNDNDNVRAGFKPAPTQVFE